MTIYRVKIRASAINDLDEMEAFLCTTLSQEGANKYIENMIAEVQSLSVYADLYRPSKIADIGRYHPQARRMVSHNRRWVYIFHIESDMVIVDRIRPTKLITK